MRINNIITDFFRLHNFLHIYVRRVYFTCFGRKGPSSRFFTYTFYINLFFATPPTFANVYINGGGGCCLPFGVYFSPLINY
jgi:hypothetical protein